MRRPAAPTAPGAPGERRRPSNCPHCSPSEPVRTQVIPSDRPRGRWRAAAYGPRVGGPDPADTPTKGGSRGAAPPGNLGIRTGQRPTIHRLHRCRGPNGPRASVIPAMWAPGRFYAQHKAAPGRAPVACLGVTGAPIAGRSEPRRQPGRPDQGRCAPAARE
ncbi:hypothetical protein HCH54_007379 [Aspergillus fumigatus]